jgi:hypothetical protein
VLHPFLTLAAIVLTANHYWLDAIVATMLFGGALLLDHWWMGIRRTHSSSSESRPESEWSRESRGAPIRT